MKNSIALVGMMGAGKSEIGKRLSNVLGFRYIDMDEEFEKHNGPIKIFFEKHGEEAFRKKESDLLKALSSLDNIVIATGGGVVEKLENRKILSNMTTFYLHSSPDILWERVKDSDRPLAQNKLIFFDLFEKRRKLYESFEKIEVRDLNPWEVVAKIAKKVVKPSLNIELNNFQKVRICDNFSLPSSNLAIISRNVKRIWDVTGIEIEDGESLKNMDNVKKIWKMLIDRNVSRTSILNVIGGGTVTDTVGFAASTFMRGIGFTLIPTSLLGMVDASIGGKFAVNFSGVKNLVGTFAKPNVFINPLFSLSLKDEIFKEGVVEALKVGIVYDKELFEHLERNMEKILKRELTSVERLIYLAVKDKMEIVEKDPFDKNFRHILNFGHTIAHAIESASDNQISHGHAVAIGMKMEAKKLNLPVAERIEKVIQKLGFDDIKVLDLEKWIKMDKKMEGSKIVIAFVEKIGRSHLKRIDPKIFLN